MITSAPSPPLSSKITAATSSLSALNTPVRAHLESVGQSGGWTSLTMIRLALSAGPA